MSVRAVLSSLSLVALGAIACLAALLMTGSLSRESSSAPEPTETIVTIDRPRPAPVESVESAAPPTVASTTPITESSVAPAEPVAEAAMVASDGAIAESGPDAFVATFDAPEDFSDQFDYGFSGQDPAFNTSVERLTSWQGDHDAGCGDPDSQRTISVERTTDDVFGGTYRDFDDLFWSCREHLMTGASTVGYNIAWFSPKPLFTDITRVCWDVNLTEIASRKWTQVMFVSEADAVRYPSARGSGGFDLGYGNPIFQDPDGVNANVFPQAGDLAGLQTQQGGFVRWFENQTQWTTELSEGGPMTGNFDKATRYTHCIEQVAPGTIRVTQERPDSHGGLQQHDLPGTIPSGPLRVVFQDDNYNGPKSENADPNFNTWHWDNIVIE